MSRSQNMKLLIKPCVLSEVIKTGYDFICNEGIIDFCFFYYQETSMKEQRKAFDKWFQTYKWKRVFLTIFRVKRTRIIHKMTEKMNLRI